MKNLFKALIICIVMAAALPVAAISPVVNKFGNDTQVSDPVLLYTGGLSRRAPWTQANLRLYLTHVYADGHREWFYDSFIFNETQWTDATTGEVRVLVNAGGGQLPATQADWTAYLDHIFATTHDIGALEKLITTWIPTLGQPSTKHKVIIGLPTPCKDGRGTPNACSWKKFNWGTVNGVAMDFSKKDHRIQSVKWVIDQIVMRFTAKQYKNLELAGVYWVEEDLYTNEDIIKDCLAYAHTKGLRTYWIPYWTNNDRYALNWKDYGFDMAWRQPNYFFYLSDGSLPPKSQLTACISSCKKYGMGVELEFETQYTSNGLHSNSPAMHQRLIDYIDAFEANGVWSGSGVAHYAGSKGFVDIVNNGDATDQATADRLCDIVKKRTKLSGISVPVADTGATTFAYTTPGYIHVLDSPDGAVYALDGKLIGRGNGSFACPAGMYVVNNGKGRTMKIAVK